MVANVAGNMYGLYPNIYNNQIALNDLSGFDVYYPGGLCTDPAMTMQGSIFGGGMMPAMGSGMMMPGITPGMMPGMMPSFGSSGNYEDYYKQYERYQDFMIDSQVRQQQKMRNADMKLNAPTEGIKEQAEYLKDKIVRNEQQQIKQAYDSFVASVKNLYGEASDEEIQSRANSLYKQLNNGNSLIEDIRKYGRGSFTQGLYQTMTFGLFNRKTAEETVSDITGQPVGTEEKALKIAGNVAGGMVVGGGIFGLSKIAGKALGIASKSRTAWGMAIGAIGGVLAAIAGSK